MKNTMEREKHYKLRGKRRKKMKKKKEKEEGRGGHEIRLDTKERNKLFYVGDLDPSRK